MKHAILLKLFFFIKTKGYLKKNIFWGDSQNLYLFNRYPTICLLYGGICLYRKIYIIDFVFFQNLIGKAGKYMSHDWSNQYWIGNLSQLVAASLSHRTSCRILFFKCSGALLM